MDYNEDRQVKNNRKLVDKNNFLNIMMESDDNDHANIYLSTIGKFSWICHL